MNEQNEEEQIADDKERAVFHDNNYWNNSSMMED